MVVEQSLQSLHVAVVIPAYRAKAHLRGVVAGLPAWVRSIIIVDDASGDGTAELADEIARRKWVHVPCTGRSPDGSHEEPGLAVACGRREAISLARRFGQAALYWWDGEALWIEPALASTPREQLTPSD